VLGALLMSVLSLVGHGSHESEERVTKSRRHFVSRRAEMSQATRTSICTVEASASVAQEKRLALQSSQETSYNSVHLLPRHPGRCASVRWLFAILTSRPLHVPLILMLLGALSCGFASSALVPAIICQLVFSSINDLSVSVLNELTGTSAPRSRFRALQASGQTLRRLGNLLTSFTGPLLFAVVFYAPFLLFGVIVLMWSCLLWSILYHWAGVIVPHPKASWAAQRPSRPSSPLRVRSRGMCTRRSTFRSKRRRPSSSYPASSPAALTVALGTMQMPCRTSTNRYEHWAGQAGSSCWRMSLRRPSVARQACLR